MALMRLSPLLLLAAATAVAPTPALAQEPPVTLPAAGGSPQAPAPDTGWGRRRAASDEVRYSPTLFARDAFPLAGFHHERFYLRDPEDRVRIFPGGLLQIDSKMALGRGVDEVKGPRGEPLQPGVLVRRARLDLGGQIHGAWSFYLSGEFAGPSPSVEYALVDLGFHRLLHLSLGRQLLPFTQANRTYEASLPWLERPSAVRFALPRDKDVGAMAWGEATRGLISYEVGVFGGDNGKANADQAVDLVGRVALRPLSNTDSIAQHIQIGGSAMRGVRQYERVGYALDPMTTEGGYVFWDSRRAEGGQTVVVLPSGEQLGFAGEVRVPVSRFDLRFEFVYSKKNTREAIEGREMVDNERFGVMKGTAFYAHLGVWLLGAPTLLEPAGRYRPPRIRFPHGSRPTPDRGLLLSLRFDAINAAYDPGSRKHAAGDERPERDIKTRAVTAGLNYYAGRHAAVLLHYTTTLFPDASAPQLDPQNIAAAPGNLAGHSGAQQLHELAGRVQISFLTWTNVSTPPPPPEPRENGAAPPAEPRDNGETPAPSDSEVPILPEARKGSLLWRVGGVLKTMRPHQWMKNTFVLAPVFFAKDIFNQTLLINALAAFLDFCLLAGAVYTMNDLVDVEIDRNHPVKKFRPIPSGRVPEPLARAVAVGLVLVSLGSALLINPWFALVAFAYFAQNVAYSFRLKNVAYLDVCLISAGFVLRVVAGGLATGIKVSNYLFVCTALLALFLGFGKRRHELGLDKTPKGSSGPAQAQKIRKSLKAYTERGLNAALAVTALATTGTYLAYTLDPNTRQFFHNDWLWPSTGFTILGMARFLQIVTGRPKSESPTQEMLRDIPFLLILGSWVLWVMVTLYQIRPTVTP